MEKFAEYGFNKSHSAAYALVAYQTAWLKVHYPAEFMAAVLSSDMDNTDKVVGFLDEARAMGLTVLPPDVNASALHVRGDRREDDPLRPRRGEGRRPRRLRGDRRGAPRRRPFARPARFLQARRFSSKLNQRALEALVHAGALDALGTNRASLMLQLPEVLKATEQLARERDAGQVSLFGGGEPRRRRCTSTCPKPTSGRWCRSCSGERETLGHYLSGHPLDPYRDELRALVGHDLGDLEKIWENAPGAEPRQLAPEVETVVAGQVVGLRKKGDSQMFVQIEDGRGRIECAFFAEAYNEFAPLLARDRILVIEGGLREDGFSGGFALRARALLGLRAALRQARAAAVAAARPARSGDLAAHRRPAGAAASGRHAAAPGPAARRRGGHAGPQRQPVGSRRCGPARRAARDAGRARGQAGVVAPWSN